MGEFVILKVVHNSNQTNKRNGVIVARDLGIHGIFWVSKLDMVAFKF